MSETVYMVTGASGQLGKLAIDALKAHVAPAQIIGLVRKESDAEALRATGIGARIGDYDDLASLEQAFAGVDRLLLISSSAIGQRARQHGNAVAAAKAAGVKFIAYTSILDAAASTMALAEEHKATETLLRESGIAWSFLRNGWYSENLLAALETDLSLGQHFGAAGEGKFSVAPRHDYAEAASVVLAGTGHEGKIYELAGDTAVTLADYAALVSQAAGKPVAYIDLPEADYAGALIGAGLPEGFAKILAESDAKAAAGALFDDSQTLSQLIGHPTEPMAETIARALA